MDPYYPQPYEPIQAHPGDWIPPQGASVDPWPWINLALDAMGRPVNQRPVYQQPPAADPIPWTPILIGVGVLVLLFRR